MGVVFHLPTSHLYKIAMVVGWRGQRVANRLEKVADCLANSADTLPDSRICGRKIPGVVVTRGLEAPGGGRGTKAASL